MSPQEGTSQQDHNWHHRRDWPEIGQIHKPLTSGTKKEPKPKLLSPDIFRWGMEAREIKLFWQDIPGFCRDIPRAHA